MGKSEQHNQEKETKR